VWPLFSDELQLMRHDGQQCHRARHHRHAHAQAGTRQPVLIQQCTQAFQHRELITGVLPAMRDEAAHEPGRHADRQQQEDE
jgi:hypothetical protein